MDEEITEEIPQTDSTPSIIEQAKVAGWNADYYYFGKLEGEGSDYFNAGLIERPDGIWMLTRASGLHAQGFMYGQNSIVAFKMDGGGKIPTHGKILRWP